MGIDLTGWSTGRNLYGAIEFYQEAQRAGIKPIIGCEAYIAPRSHKDRPSSMRESAYHFTLDQLACRRAAAAFAFAALFASGN